MPAVKPPRPAPAWARAHCCSRTSAKRSARCRATRPSAVSAAATSCVRSMLSMASMARAIDRAGIQFRVLNRSKGPAVRGPRAQADRALYRKAIAALLEQMPGLTIITSAVEDLMIDRAGRVAGVISGDGRSWHAGAVVLTTGTFLRGEIHLGLERWPAGRVGDPAAIGLAHRLDAAGFTMGRLKTGTPPRLDGRTIDYGGLACQAGDHPPEPFSTLTEAITNPQVDCAITATTAASHDLIRANLDQAPMYAGRMAGTGVRYCPSIEDKVVRFAETSASSDLSRAGRAGRPDRVSERHLDVAAASHPNGVAGDDPGLGAARSCFGPDMPSNTTMSTRASSIPHSRRAAYGPVPCRPDQRHDRIRRGGRPGTDCRASTPLWPRPAMVGSRSTAPTAISGC